jgi:hypothetical protein
LQRGFAAELKPCSGKAPLVRDRPRSATRSISDGMELMAEKPPKRRTIVIGGSIAGLFVGAFLRRIGWQVDIYERSSIDLIGRGVGIVATHLELFEALDKCGAGTVDIGVIVLQAHHIRPSAAGLAKRDLVSGPVLDRSPISGHGHGVIIEAGKVLDEVIAGVVPNVDPEGKIRLGFHGQVQLDSSWPDAIYRPCCCVLRTSPKSSSAPSRPKTAARCAQSATRAAT